jgi:hypothetical protein
MYRYMPKYLHFAGGTFETTQPEWVRPQPATILALAALFEPPFAKSKNKPNPTRRRPALHCTALHCAALHCTALHCAALQVSELTPAQQAVVEPPYIYDRPLVANDGVSVIKPRVG